MIYIQHPKSKLVPFLDRQHVSQFRHWYGHNLPTLSRFLTFWFWTFTVLLFCFLGNQGPVCIDFWRSVPVWDILSCWCHCSLQINANWKVSLVLSTMTSPLEGHSSVTSHPRFLEPRLLTCIKDRVSEYIIQWGPNIHSKYLDFWKFKTSLEYFLFNFRHMS